MNKLFVYGIFLGEGRRREYGMRNPEYDTVAGYATWGDYIVQACPVRDTGVALTGLTVDVNPNAWAALDRLERGYDRILVTTNSGITAYMYVSPENRGENNAKSTRKNRQEA